VSGKLLSCQFFFCKNNIKVNQLVNGWVTLPSMPLQKGNLKKEQKKKEKGCVPRGCESLP